MEMPAVCATVQCVRRRWCWMMLAEAISAGVDSEPRRLQSPAMQPADGPWVAAGVQAGMADAAADQRMRGGWMCTALCPDAAGKLGSSKTQQARPRRPERRRSRGTRLLTWRHTSAGQPPQAGAQKQWRPAGTWGPWMLKAGGTCSPAWPNPAIVNTSPGPPQSLSHATTRASEAGAQARQSCQLTGAARQGRQACPKLDPICCVL